MIRINLIEPRSSRRAHCQAALRAPLLWTMFIFILVCGAALLATGCSFQTPATTTPIPDPGGISKSFFVDQVTENVTSQEPVYDGQGRLQKAARVEARTVLRPKTFLCGWAPISEAGDAAEVYTLHQVQMGGHCNIEFEITKDELIGRLINPSFPQDRTRWKQIISIAIAKHYYYEHAKDSSGRDTNEVIENESRSDWSARPYMKLDFSRVNFSNDEAPLYGSSHISQSTDVEWDNDHGFLGFTIDTHTQLAYDAFESENYQGRFRVNFLRFEHNPNFVQTPYSSANANYMNVLHILGEVEDGDRPILYAAHWDMTKLHKIYTFGMPKELHAVAKAVIDSWNDVFEKELGLPRAFEINFEGKNKYGFDLRYSSMTWVSDMSISLHSPLGIGTTLADVKNGEILWGNLTLWGGYLERYIKGYIASGGDNTGLAMGRQKSVMIPPLGQGFFQLPTQMLAPPDLRSLGGMTAPRANLIEWLAHGSDTVINSGAVSDEEKTKHALQKSQATAQAEIAADQLFVNLRQSVDMAVNGAPDAFAKLDLATLSGIPAADPDEQAKVLGKQFDKLSPTELRKRLQTKALSEAKYASGGVVFDMDRRAGDVLPGYVAALAAPGARQDFANVYQNVVRELIIHEFGHVLGLGHQFKENILPAEGSVPPKYLAKLQEDAKTMENATSVMGYKHPTTEVTEKGGDAIKPGPQDVLTLRYLYKREYATYRPGSGDADFTFFPLPANGRVPARHPEKTEFVAAYFPQCNDFQATLSMDPYCNRFDRGYNAETIVKTYFDDLNANLISSIYPFADANGGNAGRAENFLWFKALSTTGRIRLFYDYMRQKYATEIGSIAANDKDLYEFSRVCSGELAGSAQLTALFRGADGKENELGELCRVNRSAIHEFATFLVNPGPDRTRMDWDNSYNPSGVTGGDAHPDHSHAFGTYTALSVLPLKVSALNALTTTMPYFFYGPWMLPVFRYADAQGLFSYSSLYPYEFTQTMASTVEKNLKFASDASTGQVTSIGVPVLMMGNFLQGLLYSNDSTRFPKDYLDTIRDQTGFRIGEVAVIMGLKSRDDSTSGVMNATHFETKIYDFRTGKMIEGSEAYILPGGKVIVRGPNRNFIFPNTKFQWLDDKTGYVMAYRIDYDAKHDDVLASHSVKTSFEKLHKSVLDACLNGQNDGLSSFFSAQTSPNDFPGFTVLAGVSRDKEMQIRFLDSVQEQFNRYYAAHKGTHAETCEESLKGLGMIVSSAAIINGWFLPEALDYILK